MMKFWKLFFLIFLITGKGFLFSGFSQDSISYKMQSDTVSFSGKIDEVTVTAFRAPYNLFNIPAPVNLILPVQLNFGTAFTPVEALNQVPGVLMHHATLSTNRLTIRGIGTRTPYGSNKIKAYFGEIPLSGGDGETAVEDLDNLSIRRVEIIKGPSSSLYGAGLGGTLLFHPKSIETDYIRHQSIFGSFNSYKNTLTAGLHQDGMYVFVLGSILNSRGFRENNSTHRINTMLHSEFILSRKVSMEALFKLTKIKAYIPSSLNLESYLNNPEQAAGNWAAIKGYEAYTKSQLGLSVKITPDFRNAISLAAFGSLRDADEPRPFNLLLETSNYAGMRGYYQKTAGHENIKTTVTTGFELFRENYNWSTWLNENTSQALSDNREKRSYENLFIQAESAIHDRLYLSAGINGNLTRFKYTDRFTEDGNQSGRRSYEPVLSPRIGANYTVINNFSVFGNVSHGFSTPSFEETLFPEGQINPDIKPETGWNIEAGLRTEFNNRIRVMLSYYRIYIKNLLVARRTGEDAYVGVNAGESVHPGLEAELRWLALNPGSYPSLAIDGNVTLANYHFRDFVDGDNDYSGNLLPGTSRILWLLTGNFEPAPGYSFRAWHRVTGKMPVNDANTVFNHSFGITNVEFSYNRKIRSFPLEVKAGVQNVFDIHHASMLAVNAPALGTSGPRYYYPGNPRNYFISLSFGWQD